MPSSIAGGGSVACGRAGGGAGAAWGRDGGGGAAVAGLAAAGPDSGAPAQPTRIIRPPSNTGSTVFTCLMSPPEVIRDRLRRSYIVRVAIRTPPERCYF